VFAEMVPRRCLTGRSMLVRKTNRAHRVCRARISVRFR
jgi:hypothetical protein